MVLTWKGWRPPGRAPALPRDSPLGGMLGFWLEKTPWPQQQGFGSNPKVLVRTALGQEAAERAPTGFFGGTACMAALKSPCRASSHPATLKRASEQGGEQAEVVKY